MSERPRDHVFVRGLTVQAVIGVHPHERTQAQRVVFDIEAGTDARAAARHDDIAREVTNYSRIREIAIERAQQGRYRLVETLAEHVAERVLRELGVAFVRVGVTKPDAYPDAEGVGVIVTRSAADLASDAG